MPLIGAGRAATTPRKTATAGCLPGKAISSALVSPFGSGRWSWKPWGSRPATSSGLALASTLTRSAAIPPASRCRWSRGIRRSPAIVRPGDQLGTGAGLQGADDAANVFDLGHTAGEPVDLAPRRVAWSSGCHGGADDEDDRRASLRRRSRRTPGASHLEEGRKPAAFRCARRRPTRQSSSRERRPLQDELGAST
jgi:hypothetical protein